MGRIVHARLDDESERLLSSLRRRTGLPDSELLRRGLKALAVPRKGKAAVVGLGRFASGARDLGSDKRHLRGFGQR